MLAKEALRLHAVLGDKILQMKHMGSTSVPGLCAKPVIDILMVVEGSADERSHVPALEAAGYRLVIREPEWFEHRMFKGHDIDINFLVFSRGTSEVQRMLRFRDWLRANKAHRDRYAQVKWQLAQQTWRHVQDYADAKLQSCRRARVIYFMSTCWEIPSRAKEIVIKCRFTI